MATFRSHLCMVKGPGELYFQTALNEQMPAKNLLSTRVVCCRREDVMSPLQYIF